MRRIRLKWLYQKSSSAVLIYLCLLVLFIGKMEFYQKYVARFPDEGSHLAYIGYLEDTGMIIPDFGNMYFKVSVDNVDLMCEANIIKGRSNYLGHPPLYYHLMRLSDGIEKRDRSIFINVNRLRDFSQIIACIGMIIAFYIGLTRLKSNLLHLLYGLSIVSIPMLAYDCAGINNDTLAFLGVTIVLLALLRVSEGKRKLTSYILLALGVFTSALSKLTSGLIVLIACLIFLIRLLLKEKSFRVLFNRNFAITVPVYLVVFFYFIYLICCYGTVQPSLKGLDPEHFYTSGFYVPVEERVLLSFSEYLIRYTKGFLGTWTGIASHVSLTKGGSVFGINRIALFLILVLPAFSFLKKNSESNFKEAGQCLYIGAIAAMLYQFYNAYINWYCASGYLGAYQSRYYLCVLPAFAYLICMAVEERYRYAISCVSECRCNKKEVQLFFGIIIITFCFLLVYEDFIYFRIHFNDYL